MKESWNRAEDLQIFTHLLAPTRNVIEETVWPYARKLHLSRVICSSGISLTRATECSVWNVGSFS